MDLMEQAIQRAYDGRLIKRWFVTFENGHRAVTWAATRIEAKLKFPGVKTVKPAPPLEVQAPNFTK